MRKNELLAEQARIVSAVESLQIRSSRARVLLSEVGPLIGQLRQSVLRAAFSGKLTEDWRASHRVDEPASELLLRIRTERREHWETDQLTNYEAKGKQPPKNWQDKYKEPEPVDESELPELPDGWCWAAADELTEVSRPIIYGIIQPGPDTPGGVPYVRITEMKGRRVHVKNLRRCNKEREGKFARARLRSGDILISKDGATYGMVAIVPNEAEGANITQHVLRFSVHSSLSIEYIAYMIEAPDSQFWIDEQIKGMAMPGINVGDFRRLPVPLPPRREQDRIVQLLDKSCQNLYGVGNSLASAESSLTKLDQSVLAKAFRGELVPQDPSDEPASVLLERIKEQKNTMAKASVKPKRKAKDGKAVNEYEHLHTFFKRLESPKVWTKILADIYKLRDRLNDGGWLDGKKFADADYSQRIEFDLYRTYDLGRTTKLFEKHLLAPFAFPPITATELNELARDHFAGAFHAEELANALTRFTATFRSSSRPLASSTSSGRVSKKLQSKSQRSTATADCGR